MTTTEKPDAPVVGATAQKFQGVRQNAETKLRTMVDMLHFFGQVFAAIPATRKYSTEVIRQVGIVVLSSGFVIVFMQLVSGFSFAVEGNYIMRQFGATGYVAVFPTWGGLRFSVPEMAGWILAAKVGCGLVAEIGSARISDEIDALEVMGINSKVYMVTTRVLAAMIAMPFLFVIGLCLYYLGAYLASVYLLHTVSEGGFLTILWLLQNSADMAYSVIFGMACGLSVILVGCYYGYHASGGPVGVGQNTARSMIVNMVLVSTIGLACGTLFWGGNPNAPIGN